jgi:hypothetical protein
VSIKVLLMCRVLCEMMRTLIFGFSVFLPCNYASMFVHSPIKDEALFVNVRFLNGDDHVLSNMDQVHCRNSSIPFQTWK